MSLQEGSLPIIFAGGIDTKTDQKSVAVTKLTALENGVFDKATTIIKRNGYDALDKNIDDTSADAYVTPKAITARGSELALFADDRIYSHREQTSSWNRGGRVQSIVHSERAIANTGTDQSMADHATLLDITALAWEDSRGGVWYALVDASSGRQLFPPTQIDPGAQDPRVIVNGDRLHIYFTQPNANRILVLVINPSSYTEPLTPRIVIETLSSTLPSYDIQTLKPEVLAALGVSGGACAAWVEASTLGLHVAYITPNGTIGYAGTGYPAEKIYTDQVLTGSVSIVNSTTISGPRLAVAFNVLNQVLVRIYVATNLSIDIPPYIVITVPSTSERVSIVAGTPQQSHLGGGFTNFWVFAEERDSVSSLNSQDNRVYVGWTTEFGNTSFNPIPLRGHGLASKAFLDNGVPYVMVAHHVPFFPYVGLIRADIETGAAADAPTMTCVGRLIVGSSDGLPVRTLLPQVHADGSDARIHRWVALSRDLVNVSARQEQFTPTGTRLVTLDFDHPDAFQTAAYGPDLVVAGALPMLYDGDSISEFGFHTAPDGFIVTATINTPGSEMAPSSTYLYVMGYETTDAQGLIHQGPLSVGTLITLGSTDNQAKLAVPTYRLTSKRHVSIVVYRSEANDEIDPETGRFPDLYRVTAIDPSGGGAGGANGYLENETTADILTFLDSLSDADLILRERAYTNGGVLSNDPAGLGHLIAGGKDRLFFSDPTDPNVVRFTQARRDGYGPDLPADLSIRFDSAGGEIGAIAVLDDAFIAFEERSVLFVTGPGPLPNPDLAPQVGFSSAQQIPSDVGCDKPRSIAVLTDRIMFQASRNAGIYQLDRARQISYIGVEVEAYNSQIISSTDLVPGTRMVIFLTATGRTLMFDYEHGQWSTFTNHEGLDSAVVDGVYHYLRSNPSDFRVFRSSSGYLDAGLGIPLYLETAWIKLQGYHQGLQRIWHVALLGNYKSSHVLEVKVATDYRPGWDAPYVLSVDQDYNPANYGDGPYGNGPYGGQSDSVYQQRIPASLKCQAIRFAIGEANNPTPQGASFELTELLLTGGVMRPMVSFGVKNSWGVNGSGSGGFG